MCILRFTPGSYQRYCGFKNPLSAADMVYCITALAEHKDLGGVAAEQVRSPLLRALEHMVHIHICPVDTDDNRSQFTS